MEQNIQYEAARDMLLQLVKAMHTERVALPLAEGRILAEEVSAQQDVPPFDRSPYDGYAFRAEDTADASSENPAVLKILEEIPAGSMWTVSLQPGTAVKILTGAPLPPGADAVEKYEETEFTDSEVKIFSSFSSGDNVVTRGEDVHAGDQLASAGTVIDSALLGTLAAQNIAQPLVYGVPKIGILTSGSELLEPGSELQGGKIINTNRYTFTGAIRHCGCEPVFIGAPKDDPDVIAACIDQALNQCDMLITTGGVSVGDYDFTPAAMELAGVQLLIRTLKLKPGGASAYGIRDGKLVCGLSGNPASALVNFYAVVLPAVRKMMGLAQPMLQEITVSLADDFKKKSPKTRLIRGTMLLDDDGIKMRVNRGQGNGVLHSLIGCNLLAVIPARSPALSAGTKLRAYLIP